jgi:aspartyl-tRNA(Asn)/glutamyl-tRNA(Gln) amidotransferase subunit C
MTNALSREDVAKVASLARLRLTEDELELFTTQLANVLAHADDLKSLASDGLAPTAHPFGLINITRPDVARPGIGPDAALAAAPDPEEGRFGVPRIVGEAP